MFFFFFFFHHTATTEIYTLSLHDALPISIALAAATRSAWTARVVPPRRRAASAGCGVSRVAALRFATRSEEHTSELQSLRHLVCRLLLEKKKKKNNKKPTDRSLVIDPQNT